MADIAPAPAEPAPSRAAMSARALARDYHARVIDPIMAPALTYVRRAELPLINRGAAAAATFGRPAETSRGAAAAATWTFRGDARRRGRDADNSAETSRGAAAAATFGRSAETSLGAAAAATRTFRGDGRGRGRDADNSAETSIAAAGTSGSRSRRPRGACRLS